MEGVCAHRLALTRQPLDNAWGAEPGALVAGEVEAPAPPQQADPPLCVCVCVPA